MLCALGQLVGGTIQITVVIVIVNGGRKTSSRLSDTVNGGTYKANQLPEDVVTCTSVNFYCATPVRHASAIYAMIVSLSVTSQCFTEMAERRIMQTMPHDSPWTLVF